MISKTLKVQNKIGLHARPAALLISEAKKYNCLKTLTKGELSSDLRGIITVLKMQCKLDDELTLTCDGEDEGACVEAITALFETKFGES